MILIPVLKKDHEWKDHIEKLHEEFNELDSILKYKNDCYTEEEAGDLQGS